MSKRSSAGNNSSSNGNSSSKGKDNGNGNSSSSNKKPSAPASPTSNPSDETNFNYFHLPSSSTPAAAYNTMLLPNYANAFPAVQTQPLIPIPPGSMPIPQSLPHFYDASNDSGGDDDDKPGKKRRTNYRRPENAAKLNAAVNALIMQKQDPNAPKDIRSVSKIFNIPYNTLRDNYLRVTTGDVRSLKRPRNDGESSFDGNVSDFGDDGEYHDNDNEHEEDNGSSEDRPPPVPKKKSSKEK